MDKAKVDRLRRLGLILQADRIDRGECPTCGRVPGDFRDDLSRVEYGISGMCQDCQDICFADGELDDGR